MDERLYQALERIADALKEQNRQNAEWIVMQTKWRHKDKEDDVGKRLLAIHEENARMQKEWVEEQRKMLAEYLAREYEAYIDVVREEVRKKMEEKDVR